MKCIQNIKSPSHAELLTSVCMMLIVWDILTSLSENQSGNKKWALNHQTIKFDDELYNKINVTQLLENTISWQS